MSIWSPYGTYVVAYCSLCEKTVSTVSAAKEHEAFHEEERRIKQIDKAVDDAWEKNRG